MSLYGLAILLVLGAVPLERVELKLPGRVTAVVPADVSGNGEDDLLVFWVEGYPPDSRRRVSLFCSAEGRVEDRPTQVISLDPRAVAFDVGDVDQDGRADILLLRADGVWAVCSGAEGRFSSRARPVVKVMTVAAMPHEDQLPRLQMLLELGEGRRGLLVPTVPIGPMALYRRDDSGEWKLARVLRVPARMSLHTSAEDLRASRDYSALFVITYPRWEVADQNGDSRADLLFFSRDSVAVFRAGRDGSFAAYPDLYRGFDLLDTQERIQRGLEVRGEVGDVNGDSRADLLFTKTVGGISNMRTEAQLFVARPDGGYPPRADLIRAREGHGASARLLDVDGDGRSDLVWPHVEMGLANLVRMMLAGRMEVIFEIYLSRDGAIAPAPDLKLSSALGINFRSAQELTGPYPIFDQDFDGDGIRDLVIGRAGGGSGDAPDRLEIRLGTAPGKYAANPAWRQDLHGTRFVLPLRLRPGDHPGLLIFFSQVEERRGDVWVLHNTGKWR